MYLYMKTVGITETSILTDSGLTPQRLETFFDAIYAIVMTIMVLGLLLPSDSGKLSPIQIIYAMFPQLYYFAITFFILAAFWCVYHRILVMVKRLDPILIGLTFFILFITSLLPFTSSFSGDNYTDSSSVLFFDLNLLILGILFTIQWVYIVKAGLIGKVKEEMFRYFLSRLLIVPSISLIACFLVQINPFLSSASYMLIFLLYIILISYNLKQDIKLKKKTDEVIKFSLAIPFNSSDNIYKSLSLVAKEMGTSREELVKKILTRWDEEKTVNIGDNAKLCNICKE